MRKVALAVVSVLTLAGCSSIDCAFNSKVISNYAMYDGNDNMVALGYYLTVSTPRVSDGQDTTLINLQGNVSSVSLPMSYAQDVDELHFILSDSTYAAVASDVVYVSKTNEPVFESVDCTPRYNHTILGVSSTHAFIDTVIVNNNKVTNDTTQVHFHIRLRSSL